jgi:phosphoribosylamine--glycine ligase
MLAIYDDKLDTIDIQWKDACASCVVMASGGYPKSYPKGLEITGLDDKGQTDGVFVYHAGTKYQDGKFLTNGGRVLGVTAIGNTLQDALNTSYKAVETIHWDNVHYRKDIGKRALAVKG